MRRRGFTLIELLVAISILGLVAVLGWRGLDGIVRARVALTAQLEQTRGMQLAFAQMQSDCEHLAGTAMLHGRQNLSNDNNRLTLVRTVFAENEATRLQVVSYRVKDGVLTRRESGATRDLLQFDSLWQAAMSDTDAATGVALQAHVTAMVVRTWDDQAWRASAGPEGQATPSSRANAPTGLEVALRLLGQEASLIKVFLLEAV